MSTITKSVLLSIALLANSLNAAPVADSPNPFAALQGSNYFLGQAVCNVNPGCNAPHGRIMGGKSSTLTIQAGAKFSQDLCDKAKSALQNAVATDGKTPMSDGRGGTQKFTFSNWVCQTWDFNDLGYTQISFAVNKGVPSDINDPLERALFGSSNNQIMCNEGPVGNC